MGRAGLGYEVEILDEAGHPAAPGTVGEIAVKGIPGISLMKGYYDDPEATARTVSEEGWYLSGDKGYRDEEGWFYFVDRKCNMIKRGGENVSATEVEEVLSAHPAVAECARHRCGRPGARPGREGLCRAGAGTGGQRRGDHALRRLPFSRFQGAHHHGDRGRAAPYERRKSGEEAALLS